MQEYGDSKRAQALWDVDSDDEEEDILEPNPKLSQGENQLKFCRNTHVCIFGPFFQGMIFRGDTGSSRWRWPAPRLLTLTLIMPTKEPSLSSTKGERYQGTLLTGAPCQAAGYLHDQYTAV